MYKIILLLCMILSLLFANQPLIRNQSEQIHVSQIAKPAKRPAGAPEYSDVCFSTRWPHPQSEEDPHNSVNSATAFHATRLDWVYTLDQNWIKKMKKLGFHVGISLQINHQKDSMSIQKRDGSPFDFNCCCANNPVFRSWYLENVKTALDAGADVLQQDEPGMNYTRKGCWCPHCKALAKHKGIDLDQDWESFSKQSVVDFWQWIRQQANEYTGRTVPWSANIEWSGRWDGDYREIHGQFDFGMSDPHDIYDAPYWYERCRHARIHDKAEVVHTWYNQKTGNRKGIATLYACGGHMIVPWDQFTGSLAGGTRYWGTPEEYADLYGFVRGIPQYLDGYEDALVVGPDITDDRYGQSIPVDILNGSGELYAFVRAKPGQPEAPVVIHLVDWGVPQQSVIKLRNNAFFTANVSKIQLLLPTLYDKEKHDKAEEMAEQMRDPGTARGVAQASAYEQLVRVVDVDTKSNAGFTTLTIPPLGPWGVVVLE